jgi:hypothetical protein
MGSVASRAKVELRYQAKPRFQPFDRPETRFGDHALGEILFVLNSSAAG